MSLLWSLLDRGTSMPDTGTRAGRFMLWVGRRLALRHAHVTIPESCLIHPEARIHPRRGEIRFGEKCTVALGAIVQGNVTLGDHCSIQANSMLIGYGTRDNPSGQIKIGNYVRIAPQVMMIAGDHIFRNPNATIHSQGLDLKPITIEDDVWIAGRVNITAGVTIGKGSVIGGGSVVTKDIPPYSIAVGVPAKVIKKREA